MLVTGNVKEIAVKQKALALALGVTPPRVSQLIKDGIVIRDENNSSGAVLLFESLKNFFRTSPAKGEDEETVDYWEEKAKHERAKRQIAELRIAKLESRAYDAKTVELVMTEMLSNLRTQLLGLPSKLAPQMEGMTKEQVYESLTRELEEKLAELSEYTPELFTAEEVEEISDEDSD